MATVDCLSCSHHTFNSCDRFNKPIQIIEACDKWPVKRKKVLWLMGDFARGGCSRYTANLFPMLKSLPVDFHIMFIDDDSFDPTAARAVDCPIEKLDITAYRKAVQEADFVSAIGIHEHIPGWQILLSLPGDKLFCQVHGTCNWTRRLVETTGQYCSKYMCCSSATAALLPPTATYFIPPAPLDFNRMTRRQTKEAAKASMGLSGLKVITTASRMSWDKNLLGVAKLIKELPDNFVWLCVGRGFAENEIHPQIQDMLGSRVRIVKEWLDPPEYLDATDCFLNLSPSEGMPYTIVEAIIHGTPAASTPVGIVPSLYLKSPGRLNRPICFSPEDIERAVEGYTLEEQAEIAAYMQLRHSPHAIRTAWNDWFSTF